MTTELEQEFFRAFGIEPEFGYWCKRFDETNIADCNGIKEPSNKCAKCENGYIKYKFYPVITAEKLLQMICIYNSFQNDEASLFIPFDISNVKDIALQVITKSVKDKSLNNYYCNDVEKLKTNVLQLFKEKI